MVLHPQVPLAEAQVCSELGVVKSARKLQAYPKE